MEEEKIKTEKKEEKAEEKKLAEQPKQETEKQKEKTKEEKIKTEEKKVEKQEKKLKKTEAVVFGKDLPISTKHAIAICNFIRGKKAEEAIMLLEEVAHFKRALPMKGEIPHRKGKIMSGRYPINATKQFIKLLKQLSANATVNDLDLENAKIECKADRASRSYRRFGSMKFKRTHVTLKLKAKEEKKKQGEKKK